MPGKYVYYIKVKQTSEAQRTAMSLREILEKIIANGNSVLLSDSDKDWDASELLENLSDMRLMRRAHMVSGLYIAEINDSGYLGQVLYRIKRK